MPAKADRPKNPLLVATGRKTALKRWGDAPRHVRIHDLSEPQRRLVHALIAAVRESTPREDA